MRARAEMAHGRRLVSTRGLAGDLGRRCGSWVTAVANLEFYRAAAHGRIISKTNPCLAINVASREAASCLAESLGPNGQFSLGCDNICTWLHALSVSVE